jgi:hypothetical protein
MNVCIMIYTYTTTVETNSSKLLLMKYDVTTMIERERVEYSPSLLQVVLHTSNMRKDNSHPVPYHNYKLI